MIFSHRFIVKIIFLTRLIQLKVIDNTYKNCIIKNFFNSLRTIEIFTELLNIMFQVSKLQYKLKKYNFKFYTLQKLLYNS